MKKYIYRLCNYTFDIIGFIFLGILVWLIISTLQVSLCDAQTIKSNNFNLFVFSQNQKNKNQNDLEAIMNDTDDKDDDEENDDDDDYKDDDDDDYYYDYDDEDDEDEIIKC